MQQLYEANIEHRLAQESGIHKANVNFAVEKLYLDYDENIISFDQIEKIINSLGYKLFPEKSDDETGKMDHQNHEQDQSHADHKHTEPTKEKEIQKLRQRFLISLIFGLPIIYMVMGKMLQAPIPMFLEKNTILLEFILATIIIGASITIWLSGIKELLRFRPGMDSLIFIGTVAAYIYSIIISISIMMGKQIGTMDNLYYESAAFILIFINLGRYLEAATKGRTSLAIKRLMGSGLAAQRVILIKNGEALEKAQKINFVVFDKTGTLTKGEPKVVDIIEIGGDKSTILKLAASIEKNSEHPLAQAIINKAKLEKIELYNPTDFQAVPGQGVKAKIDNKEILLGTRKLLQENKININEFEKNISNLENLGKTVIILAFGEKVQGLLALADTLKENSQKAIKLLHENGIKTAILTGDNAR